MAKLSRRKRKQIKEKQARARLRQKGYTPKQLRKVNKETLYKEYSIIQKEKEERERKEREHRQKERVRKDKRNQARKDLHRRKISMLEKMGISFARNIPESQTRKIKLSEIENVSRETHPDLFKKYDVESAFIPFNPDKIYSLPQGKEFYVAYRDFSGNQNIKEVIATQQKKSIEDLEEELRTWNSKPMTYDSGTKKGSSGSAGDMVCIIGDKGAVKHTQIDAMARNRTKKTREHTGDYKGFQSIKLRTSVYNTDVSYREILVIATSIMPNVTEVDRKNFYENLYKGLKHIPEIQKRLPKPE
jgi:hypothetical protein